MNINFVGNSHLDIILKMIIGTMPSGFSFMRGVYLDQLGRYQATDIPEAPPTDRSCHCQKLTVKCLY